MFKAGDVLIGPYPPGSNKLRRFIVLTDEVNEPDPKVAWAYVSTSASDPTVILPAGCHPDITRDCCVIYEESDIVRVADILNAIAGGALAKSPAGLSDALTSQVQEGVFDSDETPLRVDAFCTDRI